MDEPKVRLIEPLDFSKIPVQALEAALAGYIPYKWLNREEAEQLYAEGKAHEQQKNPHELDKEADL